MKKITIITLLAMLITACGSTSHDRALSGAGIGAAAGAVGAAMTGGDVAKGVLVGGSLGAAAGAATN